MNVKHKLYLGTFCMLVSFFCFHAHECCAAAPPAEYAIWDRMPAEAAVEARLEATAPIDLYDAPRGSTTEISLMNISRFVGIDSHERQ